MAVNVNPIYNPSTANLNRGEIAEAFIGEFAITKADDEKPIVATYGCNPCVGFGGYDPTNKIAFVTHLTYHKQLTQNGGCILYNISKLVKQPIPKENPIQLHICGGGQQELESMIKVIKTWMKFRDDLPMEIVSENPFSTSLSLDSRTGEVSNYHPLSNPNRRSFSELDEMRAMLLVCSLDIICAYSPK